MTFQEFLDYTGLTSTAFWGIVVFLTSIGIEVVPKIKWNPWSTLIKWIGSKFNTKIDTKMDDVRTEIRALDSKIDKVQNELSNHISESEVKAIQDLRRDILDFCNACMNGRRHTKEQFDFVIKQCDEYESLTKNGHIPNGVIEAAIREIKRLYDKCIQEHSFLVPELEEKSKKEKAS